MRPRLARVPALAVLVPALLTIAATPAQLTVTPIHATFVQSEFATHYAVTANDPGGKQVTYQWRLIPPTADPGCNHFSAGGNAAVWHHGDQDGCNHNVQVAQGHPGTVIVVVSDGSTSCTATYFGTVTGTGPGPACSPLTQATPSAAATPIAGVANQSHGIPAWQIAIAVVVFLAVAGSVGWFLLARRDPCAELRERCRALQAEAKAAAGKAATAKAAATDARKACDDARKAREKAEQRVKAASGEGGSWIEGSEHPGERLTSHDLQLQAQYEASVRAQVQSGDITEAQGQEMLSHWGDPARWNRLRKEEKDRADADLAAAKAAESSACAEADRLHAEADSAASAAAAAQKAADLACAAADECEKAQRERAAAAAAAAPPPPPVTPPPPPAAVSPPAVSQPPPPPATRTRPDCEDGATKTEVRCVTEVDMFNLAETALVIEGGYALQVKDAEKAMAGLDRAMTVIDIGTLGVNMLDTGPLALGAWVAGKFGFPSFDTITSLPQDAALDGTRRLIENMRNIHRAGSWSVRCNRYHLKATCTVTYTCQGGHWVVTERKMSVEQIGGPTPIDSAPPEIMVPGQGADPNATQRMFGFFTARNRGPQQKLDECAKKCQG